MNKFTKRSLAWFAALMLFVSVWASVVVLPAEAATVTYKYSGSYVYNWGQRDQTATFLSPMAEAFYSANNVTYSGLAALSGSSTNSSVPSSALYKKLHSLMYGNLENPTSYEATKNLFKLTDCQNNASSSTKISSFYSGTSIGPAWDGGSTWNREHTWPNSKSNGGSSSNTLRETDIMMLRPASVSENSGRSNTAYGEGSSYYDPNKLGENVRGDVARIVLYVYVCWGGSSDHDGALDYMWGTSGVIQSKAILLKWMEEDPVDTWEMGRNDSVESITGTRNVFVDYPELAFKLFSTSVPSDYDSPSGGGNGSGSSSSYTIKASTNNSNYGTVSVSGNVITASPQTGYEVSSYSILSGTGTVTQNGNKFTVAATSDISVRINFAKRDVLNVQFVQSGATSSVTAYAGEAITLPAHSGAVPSGCTFLGWVSHEVAETTTMPTTYYTAGTTWYVNKAMSLYALYARNGDGSENLYTSYSGAITEGDYVIVYNGGALIAEVGSAGRFGYVEVSTTTGAVESPAANAVWRIAADGSHWTLYNASVGAYAGGTGVKNKGALLTSLTDYGRWTVTVADAGYEFVNVGNTAAGVNANLRRNGTYGYACYSTSTGGALTLYKLSAGGNGTSYFTVSGTAACDNQYSNACDTTCNLCGVTRVPADHVYTSQITIAATCGQDGVRTYICSVCTVTYTEAIAATGAHSYDNACDEDCNACGAVRATAHAYTADCDTTCNVCGSERTVTSGVETTITFDAAATQRVEFSTTVQVWENGQLTMTNNKTASSSNVANYSDPVRFYKSSEVVIAYPGMTKLVIVADTSNSGQYATPWAETLTNAGLTYTEADGVYTVLFDAPVDSVSLIASAQIRAKSISAAGAGAAHEYTAVVTAPDCEKGGYTTYTCVNCGDSYTADETAALGHDYGNACDVDCNTCGNIRVVGDHIYDNANDTTCNECGAVRQIALQIINGGLTSVSEDVNGLAFRFDAAVKGVQTRGTLYVNGSATVTPFEGGGSYAVLRMGAVVTNLEGVLPDLEDADGDYVVNVEAEYLFYHDEESASFAIRIINIEDQHKDRMITARPYYVILVEGEEMVIYGDAVTKSYNQAAQ